MAASADQIVVGFVATSGTGKTTLLERLIPALTSRGLQVGLIKHCSKKFQIDHPGKDTYRLKEAGAARVVISNAQRLGLVSDLPGALPLEDLVRRHFACCDVVLVEGHRGAGIPKVVVERALAPRGLVSPEGLDGVLAEVGDLPEPRFPQARRFGLGEVEALAEFLLREAPARSGQVAGAVLAGGQSTRLGTDKTDLLIEGASLLERSLRRLSGLCRELWVIGRRPPEALAGWGLLGWHLDLPPGRVGPLGGIYTALRVAQAPRCLITGCDMPRLGEAALRRLLEAGAEAPVVVGRGPSGRPEPLAAVYSRALLPRVEELLHAGDYKVSHLFDERTCYVDFAEQDCFFNVNTPEDLAKMAR